ANGEAGIHSATMPTGSASSTAMLKPVCRNDSGANCGKASCLMAASGSSSLDKMGRAGRLCPGKSDVNLFRYGRSDVDFDAKIAVGVLNLCRRAEGRAYSGLCDSPMC